MERSCVPFDVCRACWPSPIMCEVSLQHVVLSLFFQKRPPTWYATLVELSAPDVRPVLCLYGAPVANMAEYQDFSASW